MKHQFKILMSAFMFFTRINIPQEWTYGTEQLDKTSIYLPFIGWFVGIFSALIFILSHFLLPVNVSVLLSMFTSILITGAFHEDGFADVCDAFGGGWTKASILNIMKDSRVGAYGALGMFLMVLFKYTLLCEIPVNEIPIVIIVAHSLSRWAAVSFIYTHKYVRENDDAKAKPVGKSLSHTEFLITSILGFLPILLFQNMYLLILIPAAYMVKFVFARYINKWIGGYTGDVLGSTQQLTEVSIYLCTIAIYKVFLGV